MLENRNTIVVGVFVGFVMWAGTFGHQAIAAPYAALMALQQAFAETWKDSKFAKEFKKLTGEPADPVTGEEIHRALEQVPKDPTIKETYKQIVGAGPLPPSR